MRAAMADPPRGVDPRRLPVERGLPALHPAWLPGGHHWHFSAPTGPDRRTPPPGLSPQGGRGCRRRSQPTSGPRQPLGSHLASMSPVHRTKAPSYHGVPVPGPNTGPGYTRWRPTRREQARLLSQRQWHASSQSAPAWERLCPPSEALYRPSVWLRTCNGSCRPPPAFTKGWQRGRP